MNAMEVRSSFAMARCQGTRIITARKVAGSRGAHKLREWETVFLISQFLTPSVVGKFPTYIVLKPCAKVYLGLRQNASILRNLLAMSVTPCRH